MAQAIFVVGRRRSGTKWLSNILARHPDIASIQGRRGGILETCMFDRLPNTFGNLEIDANYYAFLGCYAKTDFYHLTGLPESFLYEIASRDYTRIFREVMDAHASRQGRSSWVQKSKSYLLPDLLRSFPDGRFLIIRRNILDNIRSSVALSLSESKRRPNLIKTMMSYYHHRKVEDRFTGRDNVKVVHYEELKADTETTVRAVCDFLGTEFRPEMLETGYEANTSFAGTVRREEVLRKQDMALFEVMHPVIRNMPLRLLELGFDLRTARKRMPFDEPRLLPSYFNIVKKQHAANLSSPDGEHDRVRATPTAARASTTRETSP